MTMPSKTTIDNSAARIMFEATMQACRDCQALGSDHIQSAFTEWQAVTRQTAPDNRIEYIEALIIGVLFTLQTLGFNIN